MCASNQVLQDECEGLDQGPVFLGWLDIAFDPCYMIAFGTCADIRQNEEVEKLLALSRERHRVADMIAIVSGSPSVFFNPERRALQARGCAQGIAFHLPLRETEATAFEEAAWAGLIRTASPATGKAGREGE
jgi:hypothetical protein